MLLRLLPLFFPLFLFGNAKPFDFKDAKGVNTIIFQLDALLESISGSAGGVSGTVHFNTNEPAQTNGTIILQASSLRVDNPVLQEHMHGEEWLHVEKFPAIEFSISRLNQLEQKGRTKTPSAAHCNSNVNRLIGSPRDFGRPRRSSSVCKL